MMRTTARDIMAEFDLGRTPNQARLDWFKTNGVPVANLVTDRLRTFNFVLVDRVIFCGSRFEFERHAQFEGEAMDVITFLAQDHLGEIRDVIAWQPRTGTLASWVGRVSMLGEEQVFGPRIVAALLVHPDPLAWLRNSRCGVVIVDRPRAADLLRDAGTLIAADITHGRDLRRTLEIPPPRIVVAAPQVMEAAE
jgi:hypothetical protein